MKRIVPIILLIALALGLLLTWQFTRPTIVQGDLLILVVGRTNGPTGQPAILLQLTNTSNAELQFTRQSIEEDTGDRHLRLHQLGGHGVLKPHGVQSFWVNPRSRGRPIRWRFTVEYFAQGAKRELRNKLWLQGVSGRALRPVFNDSTTSDWIQEE